MKTSYLRETSHTVPAGFFQTFRIETFEDFVVGIWHYCCKATEGTADQICNVGLANFLFLNFTYQQGKCCWLEHFLECFYTKFTFTVSTETWEMDFGLANEFFTGAPYTFLTEQMTFGARQHVFRQHFIIITTCTLHQFIVFFGLLLSIVFWFFFLLNVICKVNQITIYTNANTISIILLCRISKIIK